MRKPGKSPSRRRRSASARVFLADELRQVRRELEEYRSELFRAEYLPQIKPFAKVRDLFERIRRDGLKIALASSAKEDELHEYKKIAQIDDLIETDTSSADVGRSKPHPDIFEKNPSGDS